MGVLSPKKITGLHSHQHCYELKENGKKKYKYDGLISITFTTIIIPFRKRKRNGDINDTSV
jgi:hypothetical protein